jgi:hypothetical protein
VNRTGIESIELLTEEQVRRYRSDGFLDVTESLLPVEDVEFVRGRVDDLFDRWSALPRRLAQGDPDAPPLIAQIHRVLALDREIAHCHLLEICRDLARSIIGAKNVWCRFDSAIYKHPGAGPVNWHQDLAMSMTPMPEDSVHFWIPLNDHDLDSGCMVFAVGSHAEGLAEHKLAELPTYVVNKTTGPPPESVATVSVPLSVGNVSLHAPLTMHSSDPNRGTQVRKALTLEFSSGPWSAAREYGRPLVGVLLGHRHRLRGHGTSRGMK